MRGCITRAHGQVGVYKKTYLDIMTEDMICIQQMSGYNGELSVT